MFSRLFLELLPIMGIVLLGGFIVCVVLGTGISSRILSRFRALSNAATAWTSGDFSHRAPTSPNDELGQLSASLNAMANEMNDLLKEREQRAFVEERDRLARDLHDTVKQHTFAAAMQLATAQKLMSEDQPATPHVISAISLVEQARQDLAAMLLRSVNSVEIPLDKALAQRIESWSSQSGIDCQVDLLPVSMSEKVKNHTVLRIIDEALANVLRHSQARSVKVTLAVINGVTCLEIIDDGVGFDKKSVTPGMGLENLERRSKELPSGQLCITSSQGHGCQVSVNWRSQ
jgi:NarL family two-component system sensor histidine kinase LiaS